MWRNPCSDVMKCRLGLVELAMAAITSAFLLTTLIGTGQFLLISEATWLQLMLPATLLTCGYLLLITKRYLVTERGKLKADEASAESNRTLGLAYQQQGQLDMAFDKFRNCPLDETILEPLYSLSLDFERKRQFNKAQSALEYIASETGVTKVVPTPSAVAPINTILSLKKAGLILSSYKSKNEMVENCGAPFSSK